MRISIVLLLIFPFIAAAENARVLIDGTGCRTRQQAIQRIFEKLPEIDEVTILPRRDAPQDNQRIFIVESEGPVPTKEALIAALGRRAKFYKVLSVSPEASQPSKNNSAR